MQLTNTLEGDNLWLLILIQLLLNSMAVAASQRLYFTELWAQELAIVKAMISFSILGGLNFTCGVCLSRAMTYPVFEDFMTLLREQGRAPKDESDEEEGKATPAVCLRSDSTRSSAQDVQFMVGAGDTVTASADDTLPSAEDDRTCVVCMDAQMNHLLAPCGHICVCGRCAKKMVGGLCPICRSPCTTAYKAYHPEV